MSAKINNDFGGIMENRIEDDWSEIDLGNFESEPIARPLTRSQIFHAWLCDFADKIPGLLLRVVLIAIAMAAIYFNGYVTANSDFDRAVQDGWYIKNATKFEEAAKNVITPGGPWSLKEETK